MEVPCGVLDVHAYKFSLAVDSLEDCREGCWSTNIHVGMNGIFDGVDSASRSRGDHQQRSQVSSAARQGTGNENEEGQSQTENLSHWASRHVHAALLQQEVMPNFEVRTENGDYIASEQCLVVAMASCFIELLEPEKERHDAQDCHNPCPRTGCERAKGVGQAIKKSDLLGGLDSGNHKVEEVLPHGWQEGDQLVPLWRQPEICDANVKIAHCNIMNTCSVRTLWKHTS